MSASRLASLLVQEGLVSPKRIVDAFEWQVVYGGTLDTALLEMNVLGEDALVDALCRATALPTLHSLRGIDALSEAKSWFPAELADKYRAVPIAVDGNIVRVVVPLSAVEDRDKLDELGYALGRSIDPMIVTETRYQQTHMQVYGGALTERFQHLAARLRPLPGGEAGASANELVIEAEPEEREANAPAAPLKASASATIPTPTDSEPLPLDEAAKLIDQATDRNAVLVLLCRAARTKLRYAALFTVQSNTATPKLALGKKWLTQERLSSVIISLGETSPFATVVQSRGPYFGKFGDEPVSSAALKALGRKTPIHGLLLPLVLRDRVVALLYGDGGGQTIEAGVMTELTSLAGSASRAFQSLIIRAKGGDPTKRRTLPGLGAIAQQIAAAQTAQSVPVPISDQPTGPVLDRVSLVQSALKGDVSALGTIAELGDEIVPQLGARLYDADVARRRAAGKILASRKVSPALRELVESLRGELPGPDQLRQRHAAEALGIMHDVASIPRLIELAKHHDPQIEAAAQRALTEIAKQDFGGSPRKWRTWWDRHRKEDRLEWLFEGLAHDDVAIRKSAYEELKTLPDIGTDDCGYRPDGAKREREQARKRWSDEWRREQKRSK